MGLFKKKEEINLFDISPIVTNIEEQEIPISNNEINYINARVKSYKLKDGRQKLKVSIMVVNPNGVKSKEGDDLNNIKNSIGVAYIDIIERVITSKKGETHFVIENKYCPEWWKEREKRYEEKVNKDRFHKQD